MSSTMTATGTRTTWAIDPSHSLVEFSIKHMMISRTKGNFSSVAGSIVIDEERFADSSVAIEIVVNSISTRDDKRDEHLKSPDFFNAVEHPTIQFVSTAVQPINDERFTLVGELTIAGITRPVEIAATRTGSGVSPWGATVTGFEGDTVVDRKDYGLTWNMALEAGGFVVGDDVKIHLEVEAIRQ